MTKLRIILTLLILTFISKANSQHFNIDRIYEGGFVFQSFTLEFKSDGKYIRVSTALHDMKRETGTYKIYNDTIQLLTEFVEIIIGKDSPLFNKITDKYLIAKKRHIVDLHTFLDLKLINANTNLNVPRDFFYNSKKRYDILPKPNKNSLVVVTKQQFDSLVIKSVSLLTNIEIWEMQDAEIIIIIRLINTINKSRDVFIKEGIYANFIKLIKDKGSEESISVYFDWIPSRGKGFYFQKLQVELGGKPHLHSIYTIK